MIIVILGTLFILFAVVFAVVWFLFFNLDDATCERIAKLCKKLIELGHYKRAKDLLWLLSRKDKSIDVKYHLGLSEMALENYKKAATTFKSILKIDKQHAPSLTCLAKIEFIEKRYEKAFEYYLLSMKIDAKNVENFIGIAKIYFINREYEKALEVYEKASELSPENTEIATEILSCKTELYEAGGDIDCDTLLKEFDNLIENHEDIPDLHGKMAKIYAKSGNLSKAEEYCKIMLDSDAKDLESLKMMGLLMLLQQNFDAAKEYLTKAFSINPKDAETHNILSYIVCQQVDNTPVRVCRMEYYNLVKEYLKKDEEENK